MGVWHFVRGLCTIHPQSQYVIEQLDQEFAAMPALCVRRWIRHCLLAHNLSTQIQALVSCRSYLLQHYLGMQCAWIKPVVNAFSNCNGIYSCMTASRVLIVYMQAVIDH